MKKQHRTWRTRRSKYLNSVYIRIHGLQLNVRQTVLFIEHGVSSSEKIASQFSVRIL